MCGIAGIHSNYSLDNIKRFSNILLHGISHRGEDSRNLKIINAKEINISLIHSRLSILDLEKRSNQPFVSEDKRYHITYNGEIYNYLELKKIMQDKGIKFYTSSDTEVLLNAYIIWGNKCLNKINGMFSFAIWDKVEEKLFCARDIFGIKPFYYFFEENEFIFCSEPIPIAKLKKSKINQEAFNYFLLMTYNSGENSIFEKIKKLDPGNFLILKKNKLSIFKYSKINKSVVGRKKANMQSYEILDQLIHKSINSQMISDVPVGLLLSGGFDSTLIAQHTSKLNKKLQTFTVDYSEEKNNNEIEIVNKTIDTLKLENKSIQINNSEALNELDYILGKLSEPLGDSAIVSLSKSIKLAKNEGIKVLLTGVGADELFFGYSRYNPYSNIQRRFVHLIKNFNLNISPNFFLNSINHFRIKYPSFDMICSTTGITEDYFKIIDSTPKQFFNLFSDNNNQYISNYQNDINLPYSNLSFDLNNYLPNLLLNGLDRISMSYTIEGRVPYLDETIYQYANKFDWKSFLYKNGTKKILQDIIYKKYNLNHINKYKKGFAGPVENWFDANEDRFKSRISDLYNFDFINKLQLQNLINKKNYTNKQKYLMYNLYCFSTWKSYLKL